MGEAGCAWGVWSTSVENQHCEPLDMGNMDYGLVGVVRLPRKRIMGWRPCWRSILVVCIVMGGSDFGAVGR